MLNFSSHVFIIILAVYGMIFQVVWCDYHYFHVSVIVCVLYIMCIRVVLFFYLTSVLLCRVVIDNNACENATVIQVKLVFPLCLGFTKLSWQLERFFFFLLSVFHMIWFDVIKLVFSSVLVHKIELTTRKILPVFFFLSNFLMIWCYWILSCIFFLF